MVKAKLKSKQEVATTSGKDIYKSIVERMRTGDVTMKVEPKIVPLKKDASSGKTKVVLKGGKTAGTSKGAGGSGQTPRFPAKECPLRWVGCEHIGSLRDARDHLIEEHKFQPRRSLPKGKRLCTSSTLTSEAKEWGHIITLQGGRQLACMVGFHPEVSRTHGYISVFVLDGNSKGPIGPLTAEVATVKEERAACAMSSATFTWSQVPSVNEDLEPLAGLFPARLFTPRLAEGKPHERVVEVTFMFDKDKEQSEQRS
eukprot:TRINITY_DN29657_c0_g2_i1.p1 TRINITY_DN29657_c0_g2~~TRINITY_DN29657_c0_g2_i1.p1  ORF type:complete len:256 (+),score=52.26 TRINITY_DN29657_c0_g2_i1:96-863(+)